MRSLKVGDRGPEVELIQEALNFHIGKGPKIAIDGKFGWETDTRVRNFQTFHGLVVDGKVGDRTLAKLFQTKTFFVSTAMLKRSTLMRLQQRARIPMPPLTLGPPQPPGFNPQLQTPPIDWSKINFFQLPLWPPPPRPTLPWPPLNLILPPFPQMPNLPPPIVPRLQLSTQIAPGSTVPMPPPVFSPFNTPNATLFMLKFSVLSREKNAKVSGDIEGMIDDDGTSKVQTTVKAQVDILDFNGLKASAYAKMASEAGLSPAAGKVTGSTGLKVETRGGVLEFGVDVKVLKIDTEKNEVKAGPNALMFSMGVMF
jgi:hypothetical protein